MPKEQDILDPLRALTRAEDRIQKQRFVDFPSANAASFLIGTAADAEGVLAACDRVLASELPESLRERIMELRSHYRAVLAAAVLLAYAARYQQQLKRPERIRFTEIVESGSVQQVMEQLVREDALAVLAEQKP